MPSRKSQGGLAANPLLQRTDKPGEAGPDPEPAARPASQPAAARGRTVESGPGQKPAAKKSPRADQPAGTSRPPQAAPTAAAPARRRKTLPATTAQPALAARAAPEGYSQELMGGASDAGTSSMPAGSGLTFAQFLALAAGAVKPRQ